MELRRGVGTLLAVLLLGAGVVQAIHLKVSLPEMAQTADLVFVGTVASQSTRLGTARTMPVTDVHFGDVQVIHATTQSLQRSAAVITLTYAGGRLGDTTVTVSDAPQFVDGRRYLVFATDDGKARLTPVVGGPQGQFEVVADPVTGQQYVLTANGRAVIGITAHDIVASATRVIGVEAGVPVLDQAAAPRTDRVAGAPVASEPGDRYQPGGATAGTADNLPMRLEDFVAYIKTVALTVPVDASRIKRDGVGRFYRERDGQLVADALPEPKTIERVPLGEDGRPLEPPAAAMSTDAPADPLGADLYWCGQQGPPAVMEQVGAAWWEWGVNNYAMWMWNQVMDVFRYIDDDGTFNWQNWPSQESEFIGYPSSATLSRVYGSGWGATTLAVTWTWTWCSCCSIQESDIAWNPAYSWTNSFSASLGNSGLVLQRPVTLHELGHAIGIQRAQGETYDYDEPTVMHSYYHDVVEDGLGVHEADAWLIRRNYEDDRTILSFADLGVESYYASNGLHNATRSAASRRPGDSITISNVTVENISYSAQADVRIRFYLSTDKTITTGDRQMGGYWSWGSFCGECYNVGSYTTTVPSSAPPGTYYIGAIVTRNGFGGDDYSENNQTFLYSTLTVTCAGSYSVSPASSSVQKTGAIGTVSVVTTGSACTWTATDDASWVTITAGASGTGSGTVSYRVAANTGAARTGHITAAGLTHTISQAAGCLSLGVSPVGMWGSASGSLATSDCLSPVRVVQTDLRPYADRFSFSGNAGQQIAIMAASSDLDGYLYLLNASGVVIAANDDGTGSLNPRIPAGTGYFTLPSTGTYTIEVTSYGIDTGSYTLRLMGTLALIVKPVAGVAGCLPAKGVITLAPPAPVGGMTVDITDTVLAASPPATVALAQGVTSKTVTIPTVPVISKQTGTVTVSFGGAGGVSASGGLAVRPMTVKTLTLTPNPVIGPGRVTGQVTLECNAAPEPITVFLATSNGLLAWPTVASIVIPVWVKSGSFGVATVDVVAPRSVAIKATANEKTKSKTLTVQ